MARWAIALAVSGAGLAVGLFSLAVARGHPGYWFAGSSPLEDVALLVTGWFLIGCGVAARLHRPESRVGLLLAAAGFAWFLPEWNNPGVGSALAFTVGLCLAAACPPLAAHAVVAYPGGRLRSARERALLAAAYGVNLLLLGVLPAFFFDPQALCSQCPRNLLLLEGDSELVSDLGRAGIRLGLAWALVAAVLLGFRLLRAPSAARLVLAAGSVYLGLVAAWFAASLDTGYLAAGTLERRLWLGQAAALALLVAGVGWAWWRGRQARREVARLVVALGRARSPGGLQGVLADIVGDPGLVVAYPLEDGGRLVDAGGRPVELPAGSEQTGVVRDGRTVAVLAHRRGLLADTELASEVTAAARLALENERLQAEVRARVEEVRASRARIVEAGDAERKRLERDLHDGAQQRLVALSLSLRLLRERSPGVEALERAGVELRAAIEELRELAHGLYPAVLADEGLAAAVEALAEESRVPLRVGALPGVRFAAALESAAYTVVVETARTATGSLAVRAARAGSTLAVEVEAPGFDGLDLVALEDRVGSLDGRLAVANGTGRVTIRAELPCGW